MNDDAAAEVGADNRVSEVDAAVVDPRDADQVEALFLNAALEAGSAFGEGSRAWVAGVPGAFLLRRVMGAKACAALVDVVESMQPTRVGDMMARHDSAGEGRGRWRRGGRAPPRGSSGSVTTWSCSTSSSRPARAGSRDGRRGRRDVRARGARALGGRARPRSRRWLRGAGRASPRLWRDPASPREGRFGVCHIPAVLPLPSGHRVPAALRQIHDGRRDRCVQRVHRGRVPERRRARRRGHELLRARAFKGGGRG